MTIYVDDRATWEPSGDLMKLTIPSDGDTVTVVLTMHAARALVEHGRIQVNSHQRELDARAVRAMDAVGRIDPLVRLRAVEEARRHGAAVGEGQQ